MNNQWKLRFKCYCWQVARRRRFGDWCKVNNNCNYKKTKRATVKWIKQTKVKKKKEMDLENRWSCCSWKEGLHTSKAHEEWGQNLKLKPKGVIFIYAAELGTVLENERMECNPLSISLFCAYLFIDYGLITHAHLLFRGWCIEKWLFSKNWERASKWNHC